ncbi:hypothetical protein PTKIN_Ptkin17bG0043600 [Pterospermum kingtungense]
MSQISDELKQKLEKVKRESESSEDETFDGVFQADFAFFDPKPDDFHGVKTLLQAYLDNKQWDLSGFVDLDLILKQTTVGPVVKLEDDEDNGVFSVITALNLGRYKPTEELRSSFNFKFYIQVSKIYKHKSANQKGSSSTKKDEAIIYVKPEDEIFHKPSMWSFPFPLQAQQVSTHEVSRTQFQTYYH